MFNGQGFVDALSTTHHTETAADPSTHQITCLRLSTTWSGLSLLSQLLCNATLPPGKETSYVVIWCSIPKNVESAPELHLVGFDGSGPLPTTGFQWGLPLFSADEPSKAHLEGFFATGSPPTHPKDANWTISLQASLADLPKEVALFCLHILFTFATLIYLDHQEQLVAGAQLPPSSIRPEDLPLILDFLRTAPQNVASLQQQPRAAETQAFFTWCADQLETAHQKNTPKT